MPRKPKLPQPEVALPGGHDPDELAALRRLELDLAVDGYDVARVGIALGGEPAALVYPRRDRDPLANALAAARAFLRAVTGLPLDPKPEVDPEDAAALERLRAASHRVLGAVAVRPPRTVGELLGIDLSRLKEEAEDAED